MLYGINEGLIFQSIKSTRKEFSYTKRNFPSFFFFNFKLCFVFLSWAEKRVFLPMRFDFNAKINLIRVFSEQVAEKSYYVLLLDFRFRNKTFTKFILVIFDKRCKHLIFTTIQFSHVNRIQSKTMKNNAKWNSTNKTINFEAFNCTNLDTVATSIRWK